MGIFKLKTFYFPKPASAFTKVIQVLVMFETNPTFMHRIQLDTFKDEKSWEDVICSEQLYDCTKERKYTNVRISCTNKMDLCACCQIKLFNFDSLTLFRTFSLCNIYVSRFDAEWCSMISDVSNKRSVQITVTDKHKPASLWGGGKGYWT